MKRGRFCVTFSSGNGRCGTFGSSIGQTTGRKIPFFFLFLFFPLFLLSSCFFLLLFFRHLSILRRPSKVRSRRTRGLEYLEEQRIGISSFRSLRRVASFDSLIQYRFSIVSQRISLEDRRIRNSLFSRRGKIRPSVFSFSATISNVTPSTLSLQPCLQTIASLPAELSGSEEADLLIYQRIPRHFHLERSVQCRLLFYYIENFPPKRKTNYL